MSASAGPLAIVGGTSRIAQDFVLGVAAACPDAAFGLYGRRPDAIARFLSEHELSADWLGGSLDDFGRRTRESPVAPYRAVLNFVGVGNPVTSAAMGDLIFEATLVSDGLALAYLNRFPDARYVFLSSGAVYGTAFAAPADADSVSTVPINAFGKQHHYTVAKLHAEARHRARPDLGIFDVRVFNYVSRRLDLTSRLLLTDMILAIRTGAPFETADQPMVRDYLHPDDFRALTFACLDAPAGTNLAVDAYSRAPITKRELVALLHERFAMPYRYVENAAPINISGLKPSYFSNNRAAAALGYAPSFSSAEGITREVAAILACHSATADPA